jgi:FkbM family methyltransferase
MGRQPMDPSHRSVELCEKGISYKLCLGPWDPVRAVITTTSRPYERRLLAVSCRFLSAADRVVDVGANLGNHSLYWCRVVGAVVDAFEPHPEYYELLDRNVEMNDARPIVRIHRLALGADDGRGTIIPNPGNPGAARVRRVSAGEADVRRLDSVIDPEDQIRLIKVDVEGAELEVLRGAGRVLRWRPALLLEQHTTRERRALRRFLRPLGYVRVPVSLTGPGAPTYLHVATVPDRLRALLLVTSSNFWVCLTGPVHRPIRRWMRRIRGPG